MDKFCMMMGGFGTLSQANKSFKENRELLKSAKGSHTEKVTLRGSGKKGSGFKRVSLSETDRILIVQRVFEENAREKKRQLIVLAISACIATGLLIAFLHFN